jgi:hypothetical protein
MAERRRAHRRGPARLATAIAACACLAVVGAGCGSGSDDDGGSKASAKHAGTTSSATTTETAPGSVPTQPKLGHDAKGATGTVTGKVPLPPAADATAAPQGTTTPVDPNAPREPIEVDSPATFEVVTKSIRFAGSSESRYSQLRVVISKGNAPIFTADLKVTCPTKQGTTARCTFDQDVPIAGKVAPGNYTVEVGVPHGASPVLGPSVALPLTVHAT